MHLYSLDSNNATRSQIHEIQLSGVPIFIRDAIEYVRFFQRDVLVDDQFVFVQSIYVFCVFHELRWPIKWLACTTAKKQFNILSDFNFSVEYRNEFTCAWVPLPKWFRPMNLRTVMVERRLVQHSVLDSWSWCAQLRLHFDGSSASVWWRQRCPDAFDRHTLGWIPFRPIRHATSSTRVSQQWFRSYRRHLFPTLDTDALHRPRESGNWWEWSDKSRNYYLTFLRDVEQVHRNRDCCLLRSRPLIPMLPTATNQISIWKIFKGKYRTPIRLIRDQNVPFFNWRWIVVRQIEKKCVCNVWSQRTT